MVIRRESVPPSGQARRGLFIDYAVSLSLATISLARKSKLLILMWLSPWLLSGASASIGYTVDSESH